MKTGLWIGLAIVAVVALVFVALTAGWAVWGRRLWSADPFAATGGCGGPGAGPRSGMMGGCGAARPGWNTTPVSGTLTIEEARDAVEHYIAGLGYSGLEVTEVMEFEYNFYAIAQERDTGIGALELLIDKQTGAVGPEMGPNMMWNGKYGMHRGGWMMGGGAALTNTIPPEEAVQIAKRWLDVYRPGTTVEDADPFYGYYTVHTLKDGEIDGMLSVHGTTGQVWYHTWHGRFIQMLEEE